MTTNQDTEHYPPRALPNTTVVTIVSLCLASLALWALIILALYGSWQLIEMFQ
jgi:hypothetical protein